METSQFDRVTTTLAQARGRRGVLRLLGAAAFGAGGLSILAAAEGDARKRRKRKKKNKDEDQPDPADLAPDIAITAIQHEPSAEANHDNVVVKYTNKGTDTATGFRIGMSVKRANGTVRNEVFSLPLTVAPGASGEETFRLGCSWINSGTVTARTDLSPIPGEPGNKTADNLLAVTFANVCS